MTGFWIRVNARLADDATVRDFARVLFPALPTWIAIEATCGLLVTLWGRVVDEQEDGDLSARDDDAIEEWAKWRGDIGAFAIAFRERFTAGGKICEWDEYQGPLIVRREKDRERKRLRKAAEIAEQTRVRAEGHAESAPIPHDIPAEFRKVSSRNGDDNGNGKETASSPPDDVARLLAGLTEVAGLTVSARSAWEAEINARREGMHGPPLSPEHINLAAREYVADGHLARNPTLRHFGGYLEKARSPRPHGTPSVIRHTKQEIGRQNLADAIARRAEAATNGK